MAKANFQRYTAPSVGPYQPSGWTLGILISVGLFLLLPVAQWISTVGDSKVIIRSVEVSLPPPPPPMPEPPQAETAESVEPPPQMQAQPQFLSLNQLSMAINAGVGSALAGDFGLENTAPMTEVQTLQDIQLFEISQLDEPPRRLRDPMPNLTQRQLQARKSGTVQMELTINPDGSITYKRTLNITGENYEKEAIEAMKKARYTPPTVGGKPVSAKLIFTLPISF